MKLLLLGATGDIGKRVTAQVQHNLLTFQVTFFVRDRAKLEALLSEESKSKVEVIEGDITDSSALTEAFRGQEACICTAGNAVKDPQEFRRIFSGVVTAANNMVGRKRLWMLAGITVMAVPSSKKNEALNDLPIFKWLPFRIHSLNYEQLISASTSLDWSLMCPGKLVRANKASGKYKPTVFTEEAAVWLPQYMLSLGPFRVLAALIILMQLSKFFVSLDDVAAAMLDDLRAGSFKLSQKRIGVMKG